MDLKQHIRDIPDFPRPGILFRDITPLLSSPEAFRHVIETFASLYKASDVDAVAGIEARGFLFAAPLALHLDRPLVPIRKEGKLPFETTSVKYVLEYGESAVEVHTDAISPGQRVLIVDDLIATGGTIAAAARLVETSGGGKSPAWRRSSSSTTLRDATGSAAMTFSRWCTTSGTTS